MDTVHTFPEERKVGENQLLQREITISYFFTKCITLSPWPCKFFFFFFLGILYTYIHTSLALE